MLCCLVLSGQLFSLLKSGCEDVCVRVCVCVCSLKISVFSERGVCWNVFGEFQFRPYLPDTILYYRKE